MFAATVSCLIASRRLRHSSAASLAGERHQTGSFRACTASRSRRRVAGLVQEHPPPVLLVRDVRILDPQCRRALDPLREGARNAEHPRHGDGDRLARAGRDHRAVRAHHVDCAAADVAHDRCRAAVPASCGRRRAAASGSVAIVCVGRPVSSASVAAASETWSAASSATTVPRVSATPRRSHAPLSIDDRSVKNASSTAIPCSAVGIAREAHRDDVARRLRAAGRCAPGRAGTAPPRRRRCSRRSRRRLRAARAARFAGHRDRRRIRQFPGELGRRGESGPDRGAVRRDSAIGSAMAR